MNAANVTKSKMKNKVLIIMPVYNQLEFTRQALDSLYEHTDLNAFELLIINNNSSDGTKEFLDNFSSSIHIIHNDQNMGWTGSLNNVFDSILTTNKNQLYGDCNYILLANNDILLEARWLPKMLKRFDADEKVGIVGPTSDFVAGLQTISADMAGLKTEYVKLLVGFFFMMRREVLEQVGKFDEETFSCMGGGEEFDFCIRAQKLGWQCVIARDVFIKHFGSKTLSGIAGGGPGSDAYNKYCEDKDNKLIAKWGVGALTVKTTERLKVMLCIPLHTNYSGHKSFWISLLMMAKPGRWEVIECTRAMVADARNLMVQKALELGCTHVLFTDDDHILPPDAGLRLLEHDVDIVGALAFQRKKPYSPCIYNAVKDELTGDIGLTPVELIKQGLQEVTAIGFSFVLIKVQVLQKLEFPWFVYGDKSLGIHTKLGGIGEDLSFCIRAGNVGYKVFCDTDLIVPHIAEPLLVDDQIYINHKIVQESNDIIIV